MMRLSLFFAGGVLGVLVGCAGQTIKPAEVLDERTGMTVGALQEPIEFVQNTQDAALANSKRASFAYMGPVEWDRMGEITYGLWIHVAPGNDAQIGSIALRGTVTLILDDGPVVLTPGETPAEGHGPYKPVVSWGQTAYFDLNMELLKRMAASRKLVLSFKSANLAGTVDFLPTHDTSATLTEFARTRGITGD
jgi:uncharacterized protein (DUF2342 family)